MITHAQLLHLLNYDPSTGIWTWRLNRSNIKAGARAGSFSDDGYTRIHVRGRDYRSARLAWFYMRRRWPRRGRYIDHVNRDRLDDRWCNLREATPGQNNLNRSRGQVRVRFKPKCRFSGLGWVSSVFFPPPAPLPSFNL